MGFGLGIGIGWPNSTSGASFNPGISLAIAPNAVFKIPAGGNFTIEWFQRVDSNMNDYKNIFQLPFAYNEEISARVAPNLLYFSPGETLVVTSLEGLNENWATVALIRDNGFTKIYINGELKVNEYIGSPGASVGSATNPLYIGSAGEYGLLKGKLSNFRWSSEALYSSNYTPSTTPLSVLPSTKLLLFQGNTLELQLTDNTFINKNIVNTAGVYNSDNPFIGFQGCTAFDL